MTSVACDDGRMEDDAFRWDERYRERESVAPRAPEAIEQRPELDDLVAHVGRGLDIACGSGAQSLWMARRGLDVVALDVSPVAIEQLNDAAARLGLDDAIDARVVDLDNALPADIDRFDLIICQRFRDPRLYASVIGGLRSGGVAIVTVLSAVGCETPGAFHAAPGELRSAFDTTATELVSHDEGDGLASVAVRRR